MKQDLGDIAWWFDTSALTPEATAEHVVREAAARAATLRGGWADGVEQLRDA